MDKDEGGTMSAWDLGTVGCEGTVSSGGMGVEEVMIRDFLMGF